MRADAARPAGAARSTWRGLVRATNFQNSDSGLTLLFETAAPAKATVEPAGELALQVVITKLTEAEAIGSRPLGLERRAGGPGHRASRPMSTIIPGDSYELVPLKYADVSEVIGLLVPGEHDPAQQRLHPPRARLRLARRRRNQPNYVSSQNQAQQQKSCRSARPFPARASRSTAGSTRSGSPARPSGSHGSRQQIALIDIPVDSVILETQFVELTENGARNLGIDFNNAHGQIAVGTITIGANIPFGVDPNTDHPVGPDPGGDLRPGPERRGADRVAAADRRAIGSTAKIITGDALPILTSITLSGVNGVSQQVQYVNVGVTLQIAPRVSSDGFVTSQIYGVVSSVTGFCQGYPTISQREAETSASVRDGETFVIGGLTQDNSLTTKSKVPLLGDIPLVGEAVPLRPLDPRQDRALHRHHPAHRPPPPVRADPSRTGRGAAHASALPPPARPRPSRQLAA